jgi:methionyl-tRNA formyltransferase
MNVILCGYNWAGCRALDLLLASGFNVFVCTHESPPYIPSLAQYSVEKGILFTLESINSADLPFEPDCICSIYYRKIINKEILRRVNYKAMNLHPSMLPAYRGCSSLTWAIINGEPNVGFTYHYIDDGCDTGKVILQKEIPVFQFENQSNLYQRVMFLSLDYFTEALRLMLEGFEGLEQAGAATFYGRGVPEGGHISDHWSDDKIRRFIRALIHPPLPYAKYNGHEITSYEQYLRVFNENWN